MAGLLALQSLGSTRPWGNDRPWESERQYSSSSRSAALLSRRSWIVPEAAKLLVHLLGGSRGYLLCLPLHPYPQQDMGKLHLCWTGAKMRAPLQQKGLSLLAGTVLAYKGDFKVV